jgi:hypothetical protein
MSSAALPVEIIPDHRESHSGIQRKTIRLPAGITVRLQPGIVFVFTPERFSRSPRNPVHLAPESATGIGHHQSASEKAQGDIFQ